MKIVVDDVELTVEQDGQAVCVTKVVGRNRRSKSDIVSESKTVFADSVVTLLKLLKRVAAKPMSRCTCDYRYGYSDHAEHCQSIYKAVEYRGDEDD